MMRGFGVYDGYGMMGGGWLGMLVGLVLWVLFVALIVVLVIVLARRGYRHSHGEMMPGATPGAPGTPPAPGHDEAVAIARKRFASGEITKEQFDEIMGGLG
jgi:uncharacterized membrane protein